MVAMTLRTGSSSSTSSRRASLRSKRGAVADDAQKAHRQHQAKELGGPAIVVVFERGRLDEREKPSLHAEGGSETAG
jgi:hypothetical protein